MHYDSGKYPFPSAYVLTDEGISPTDVPRTSPNRQQFDNDDEFLSTVGRDFRERVRRTVIP